MRSTEKKGPRTLSLQRLKVKERHARWSRQTDAAREEGRQLALAGSAALYKAMAAAAVLDVNSLMTASGLRTPPDTPPAEPEPVVTPRDPGPLPAPAGTAAVILDAVKELAEAESPYRAISTTELGNGTLVLDIGEHSLTLTRREAQIVQPRLAEFSLEELQTGQQAWLKFPGVSEPVPGRVRSVEGCPGWFAALPQDLQPVPETEPATAEGPVDHQVPPASAAAPDTESGDPQ